MEGDIYDFVVYFMNSLITIGDNLSVGQDSSSILDGNLRPRPATHSPPSPFILVSGQYDTAVLNSAVRATEITFPNKTV